MEVNRRALLRDFVLVGGVGLAGCNTRGGSDGPPEGLARVELVNYDTTEHVLDIQLSDTSDGVLVEQTVTLAPATSHTDGERTPVPTDEWMSDFPERTGTFRLQWSLDGGDRNTYETSNVQSCKLLRTEIDRDGDGTIDLVGTVDCYGQ